LAVVDTPGFMLVDETLYVSAAYVVVDLGAGR
jgi:hypothetical protein